MEHTNKAASNDDVVVHEERKEEEGNISDFLRCIMLEYVRIGISILRLPQVRGCV